MANPFDELFKEMAKTIPSESSTTPIKDCIPEALDFVKRYQKKEELGVGDLIVWKPGMKDSKIPDYGEPIVILETLEPTRRDGKIGTIYELQPKDIRCLVFKDTDGDLMDFVYDSRRFTKYVPVSELQEMPEGV